ncbi:AAA domain-containing protein [Blastocladiella britannica]|nr:AAA domain-containing protein [Blastocladiella britannica]
MKHDITETAGTTTRPGHAPRARGKDRDPVDRCEGLFLASPARPTPAHAHAALAIIIKMTKVDVASLADNSNGVFVVALTGGPSGGKSTVQTMLSDVLENLGYKVYRVPETATILLSCGVLFSDLDDEQQANFQENLLRTMMTIEQTYFDLAKSNWANHGKKTVILCDRGTMDPSAYTDRAAWKAILNKLNLNEVDIRDNRYDMVVHLVTAADGAEEFYTLANNAARSEGLELAVKLDNLVKNAWIGHPHVAIIDNATDFKAKCHRVVEAVLNRMGLQDRRWGEGITKHKFLVRNMDLDVPFAVPFRDFVVEHRYLAPSAEGHQVRIRKRFDESGNVHCNLTTRHPRWRDGQRLEERRSLAAREYESLKANLADASRHPVVKTRRCFLWNDIYFQLDVFQSPCPGLALMEAYLPESRTNSNHSSPVLAAERLDTGAGAGYADDLVSLRDMLPPFIDFDREVTHDPAFSMYLLAKKEEDRGFVSMI